MKTNSYEYRMNCIRQSDKKNNLEIVQEKGIVLNTFFLEQCDAILTAQS